jgi:hypothetical protein
VEFNAEDDAWRRRSGNAADPIAMAVAIARSGGLRAGFCTKSYGSNMAPVLILYVYEVWVFFCSTGLKGSIVLPNISQRRVASVFPRTKCKNWFGNSSPSDINDPLQGSFYG